MLQQWNHFKQKKCWALKNMTVLVDGEEVQSALKSFSQRDYNLKSGLSKNEMNRALGHFCAHTG